MRLDYDLDAGALYINITDRPITETVEIDNATMVDVDSAGDLVGIEVLTLDRGWPLDEVFRRYPLADDERLQLRAVFMASGMPAISGG